jgi:hypothetical protein
VENFRLGPEILVRPHRPYKWHIGPLELGRVDELSLVILVSACFGAVVVFVFPEVFEVSVVFVSFLG